jgi:hypothetical protein
MVTKRRLRRLRMLELPEPAKLEWMHEEAMAINDRYVRRQRRTFSGRLSLWWRRSRWAVWQVGLVILLVALFALALSP